MTQEALKMALYYLEQSDNYLGSLDHSKPIAAIKKALAQTQEPVAWQFFEGGKWHNGMEVNDHRKHTEAAGVPVRDLYTTSPQRTWVGLTDEEVMEVWDKIKNGDWAIDFYDIIEAKLKQKNGYAEEKNT